MKLSIVALLLLLLIGCNKETNSLVGRWTLTEHFSYGSVQFQPMSRISFALHENGRFEITQYDSTQYRSTFPNYNRYRKLDHNVLLLYNTSHAAQEKITFQLNEKSEL